MSRLPWVVVVCGLVLIAMQPVSFGAQRGGGAPFDVAVAAKGKVTLTGLLIDERSMRFRIVPLPGEPVRGTTDMPNYIVVSSDGTRRQVVHSDRNALHAFTGKHVEVTGRKPANERIPIQIDEVNEVEPETFELVGRLTYREAEDPATTASGHVFDDGAQQHPIASSDVDLQEWLSNTPGRDPSRMQITAYFQVVHHRGWSEQQERETAWGEIALHVTAAQQAPADDE